MTLQEEQKSSSVCVSRVLLLIYCFCDDILAATLDKVEKQAIFIHTQKFCFRKQAFNAASHPQEQQQQ